MKKILLLIGLLIAGFALNAQSQDAYIKAMTKGFEATGQAQSEQDFVDAAGQFERISSKMKSEWYPQYYAALNYLNASFRAEKLETKDAYTSKAQNFIDNALAISPQESEIVALQGYNYMAQLAADPGSRGQTLSPKAMQSFGKAVGMNPNNPRAQVLLAQMQFGTAQFFGSSTEQSCDSAKKSLPLFDAEEKGKSLAPTWGKELAESIIQGCSK